MNDDGKKTSYYEQLAKLASGVLEVDSDVNEDEKRETLLDASFHDYLEELEENQNEYKKR